MKRGLFLIIVLSAFAVLLLNFVSALTPVSCIDMDFRNYTFKGTLYSNDINYTDKCVSYSLLTEYYCSSDENIIGETVSCPCEDGRCIECSDSDGGKVTEVLGEAFNSKREGYYDYCFAMGDKKYIREYFCLDGAISYEDLLCDGICYGGYCKAAVEPVLIDEIASNQSIEKEIPIIHEEIAETSQENLITGKVILDKEGKIDLEYFALAILVLLIVVVIIRRLLTKRIVKARQLQTEIKKQEVKMVKKTSKKRKSIKKVKRKKK